MKSQFYQPMRLGILLISRQFPQVISNFAVSLVIYLCWDFFEYGLKIQLFFPLIIC